MLLPVDSARALEDFDFATAEGDVLSMMPYTLF